MAKLHQGMLIGTPAKTCCQSLSMSTIAQSTFEKSSPASESKNITPSKPRSPPSLLFSSYCKCAHAHATSQIFQPRKHLHKNIMWSPYMVLFSSTLTLLSRKSVKGISDTILLISMDSVHSSMLDIVASVDFCPLRLLIHPLPVRPLGRIGGRGVDGVLVIKRHWRWLLSQVCCAIFWGTC